MTNARTEDRGNTTIFYLEGKLDGISSPIIQQQITETLQRGQTNIILHCAMLSYMSSAGIRVLLQSYHQAGKQSGHIVLTAVPKTIEQTLYVTGFLSYFQIFPTIEDGLLALSKD